MKKANKLRLHLLTYMLVVAFAKIVGTENTE